MDYQSNSNKNKDEKIEKPKLEKIVTGEVIQKPKGIGSKFRNIFLGGDFSTASKFVAADVLLPALRNLIVDAVYKGVELFVYGSSSHYRGGRHPDFRPRVQYNNPLNRPRFADPRMESRGIPVPLRVVSDRRNEYRTGTREPEDITFSTREEAEKVVERLLDIIDKYEVASYADLQDLLGFPTSPIHNKWGWTYLNNVEIRQTRNGYLVELPALEEI